MIRKVIRPKMPRSISGRLMQRVGCVKFRQLFPAIDHSLGDLRNAFLSESFRLSATERCLERLDLRRFWRRSFSIAWVLAEALPLAMASNCAQSSRRARNRFISRERSTWHLMAMPVGRCLRKTQFEVLLTFWPPAPEPRTNFSSRSAVSIPREAIRCSRAEVFSGDGRFIGLFVGKCAFQLRDRIVPQSICP